jgi:hypothetical protein
MRHFETEKRRSTWISVIARTSLYPELGCVQCGSRLEAPEFGKFNLTGKCFNCSRWVSEEDEAFDDLED